MRPQKIDDIELINKIIPLLRNRGFAGTSIQDLSEVTGLKKASLYHRFPGGKEDMVLAALKYVSMQVRKEILEVLTDNTLAPKKRLEKGLQGIARYYENGKSPCLFRSLSLESGQNTLISELNVGMVKWLEAFTELGIDMKYDLKKAKDKAMNVLISIQGSLVVCQTLKTTVPFTDALEIIRNIYSSEN